MNTQRERTWSQVTNALHHLQLEEIYGIWMNENRNIQKLSLFANMLFFSRSAMDDFSTNAMLIGPWFILLEDMHPPDICRTYRTNMLLTLKARHVTLGLGTKSRHDIFIHIACISQDRLLSGTRECVPNPIHYYFSSFDCGLHFEIVWLLYCIVSRRWLWVCTM